MTAPKLDALLGLGALLAPAARRLPAAVSQAFSDPRAYVDAHERALARRAIHEPRPDLPWIALLDALGEARVLVEIDWKAEGDELQAALRTLVKGFRAPQDDGGELSTWELLELSGIAQRGLQLAQLDYGSDAYALVALPVKALARAVRLAKKAGYGAVKPFGDALADAKKARIARARERSRGVAAPLPPRPEASIPRMTWVAFAKGTETRFLRYRGHCYDTRRHVRGAPPRLRCFKYGGDGAAIAAVERELAAWRDEGFREVRRRLPPRRQAPEGYRFAGGDPLMPIEVWKSMSGGARR
ncbi:MAG: DUF6630 family protein, partial [Polyangiaceae bacterium]